MYTLEPILLAQLKANDLREEAARSLLMRPEEALVGDDEIDEVLIRYSDSYEGDKWLIDTLIAAFRLHKDNVAIGEVACHMVNGRVGIVTNGNATWGDWQYPDIEEAEYDAAIAAANENKILDAVHDAVEAWANGEWDGR